MWCLIEGDLHAARNIGVSREMIDRSCARIASYARRDDYLGEEAREQLRRIALELGRLAIPGAQPAVASRGRLRARYMEPIHENSVAAPAHRRDNWKATASVSLTIITAVAAAVAIMFGQFGVALVAMVVRLACFLWPFEPPAFPQDYGEPFGRARISLSGVYLATLIGHGCDVLLRGCLAVYFLRVGQPWWSFICLASTLVGVGGSFGRTAASTIAVRVPRNFLYERIARTGGLTVGLLATLATGNQWYLMASACTMGFYGAVEMARATWRVMHDAPTEIGLFIRSPIQGANETVRHHVTLAPRSRAYS